MRPPGAGRRCAAAAVAALCAVPLLALRQADEPSAELDAVEVARRCAASVVLIRAELPDGQSRQGSGFFVAPEGVVATSLHLLDGAETLSVRVGGERFELTSVRAFDVERDLAVLQIDGDGFVAVEPGEPGRLQSGEAIYVISNPLGLAGTVSEGLLAAWREPGGEPADESGILAQLGTLAGVRLLQISAPASPGSSGAPVFDDSGRVVGVVAAGLGAGTLDLNFAVSIDALLPLLDRQEGWDLASLESAVDRRRGELAEPHLVDARFYLANEQPEECGMALDRALAIHPGSGEALHLKGRMLERAGRLEEAAELFRRAVAANPDSAEAWESLGHFLFEHGSPRDRTEGVAAFERALELDPSSAGAAYGLGIAYLFQRRPRQARALLEQAVEADRDELRAWLALGAVCTLLDDLAGAEEAYESALWIDSEEPRAVCGLAIVRTRMRDSTATELARRCEELAGDLP